MTIGHINIFHVATKYFLLLACDEVVASACTTGTEAEAGGGEHVMSCLMEQLSQGGPAMTSSCSEVLMQVNTGR